MANLDVFIPPAGPAAQQAFGFYWEMLHERSGEVVGDGFSRATLPQLDARPGYSYRITPLSPQAPREVVWPS